MPPAASPGGGRRRSPSEDAMRSVKRQRHHLDSGSGSDSDSSSGSDSDGGFVRSRALSVERPPGTFSLRFDVSNFEFALV